MAQTTLEHQNLQGDPWLADVWRPRWPAPDGVRAMFSTRLGGVSGPPYASLNLGTHVGDDPQCVQKNRDRLTRTLGVPAVFMEQVHGVGVLTLEPDTPHGLVADVAVTPHADIACTVMVADCLPVLLCTADGTIVAAAHAGWRGLLGQSGFGVLEAACANLRALGGADRPPQDILVWLGPCIGPQSFEVGEDVRSAFISGWAGSDPLKQEALKGFFRRCGKTTGSGGKGEGGVSAPKWLADLPALARWRLRTLGITQIYGNDGGPEWCTVSNPLRFFSHRRDRVSGRMAACIWRSA